LLKTRSFFEFIELKSSSKVRGNLIHNIVILLKAKSLNDFCFDPLLVTVARGCSETDAKLLANKVCEGFWLYEHDSIGLIDKDQRVLFWFKVVPYVVFNFVLTS